MSDDLKAQFERNPTLQGISSVTIGPNVEEHDGFDFALAGQLIDQLDQEHIEHLQQLIGPEAKDEQQVKDFLHEFLQRFKVVFIERTMDAETAEECCMTWEIDPERRGTYIGEYSYLSEVWLLHQAGALEPSGFLITVR